MVVFVHPCRAVAFSYFESGNIFPTIWIHLLQQVLPWWTNQLENMHACMVSALITVNLSSYCHVLSHPTSSHSTRKGFHRRLVFFTHVAGEIYFPPAAKVRLAICSDHKVHPFGSSLCHHTCCSSTTIPETSRCTSSSSAVVELGHLRPYLGSVSTHSTCTCIPRPQYDPRSARAAM